MVKANFKLAVRLFGKENEAMIENMFEDNGWDKEREIPIDVLFDEWKERVLMQFIIFEDDSLWEN